MSTGKSNGTAPAQVLEVARNGHKPLGALPGELPPTLEGDREELKTASWAVIKATSPTEEDAAPAGRMATAKLMDLIESQDERVALRAATVLYTGAQRA